jgi:hypothetical protein
MASTLTASNIDSVVGKWKPYYFKPFLLGAADDSGAGSTDGVEYITQTTGSSAENLTGMCTSSHNCGFYYKIVWDKPNGTYYFYVEKYDLNDTLLETIYASETGGSDDGRWWGSNSAQTAFTIDVGVYIYLPTIAYADNDVYKVTLPSAAVMDKRRIYHGGYASFLRMPETEGKAYHSDIIPTSLQGKNITVLFNQNLDTNFDLSALAPNGLRTILSKEDSSGNSAVSVMLEWNVNKDGVTSSTAGSTTLEWGAGETWQLGSIFGNDLDPRIADTPFISHFPTGDVEPSGGSTGAIQIINISVSGRAGFARIKTEYMTGSGTSTVAAFNQYWPIILLIS